MSGNAAYYGAIVYASEGASITIASAIIQTNSAVEGGIAFLIDGSYLYLGPKITA